MGSEMNLNLRLNYDGKKGVQSQGKVVRVVRMDKKNCDSHYLFGIESLPYENDTNIDWLLIIDVCYNKILLELSKQ